MDIPDVFNDERNSTTGQRPGSSTTIEYFDDGNGLFSLQAEVLIPTLPTYPEGQIHPDLLSLMNRCFNQRAELRPDTNMVRKITDATLKM